MKSNIRFLKHLEFLLFLLLLLLPITPISADLEIIEVNQIGQVTASDIKIIGDIAYVLDFYWGLKIYDVSDINNPELLGRWSQSRGLPHQLIIKGDLAIIANNRAGLSLIDISDPTNPVEIGNYFDGGNTNGVFLDENTIFIADWEDGLEILDITNSSNIVDISQVSFENRVSSVIYVHSNIAYIDTIPHDSTTDMIEDVSSGIEMIDISDTSNPVVIDNYDDIKSYVHFMTVKDDLLFVGTKYEGLVILDISTPDNPIEIGRYNSNGQIKNIKFLGTMAVLASWDSGVEIIDITNPADPLFISSFYDGQEISPFGGFAFQIAIKDDNIFVAEMSDGIEILQISGTTSGENSTTSESVNPLLFFRILITITLVIILKKITFKQKQELEL